MIWNQQIDDFATFAGLGGLAVQRRSLTMGSRPNVTVSLLATRCILYEPINEESGEPPDATLIQQTARMLDQDGWALRLHMTRVLREGDLAQRCGGYEFLGLQKITPQGLCVGWQGTWRYPLEPGPIGT